MSILLNSASGVYGGELTDIVFEDAPLPEALVEMDVAASLYTLSKK